MVRRERKEYHVKRLVELLESCNKIFIVTVDFVGSNHLQRIRIALRGKATLYMGKNTLIRTALRNHHQENPDLGLDTLVNAVNGNMGFLFCHGDMGEIRSIVEEMTVPAAAKAGVISQCDIFIEAGNTGMDPSQTNFFQTLNVPTKIVKGQIEIVSRVKVAEENGIVGASAAVLLQKMGVKPFTYGCKITQVFDAGSLFDKAVLDITDDVLIGKFLSGARNIAALSREVGVPTEASLPHMVSNALKNMAALCADIDVNFAEIEKLKEFLANPEAFAAAAAAAAPAGGAGAAAAAPAAAAAAPVEEEEEEDMDFDLFG